MSNNKKAILIIFGIFLSLVFIEIMLQVGGFVFLRLRDFREKQITTTGRVSEYRILCIGESTTEFGGDDSYPRQLERLLNAQTNETRFRVINEGATANNTTAILDKFSNNLEKYKPHMVIAMMGLNDRLLDIKFTDLITLKKGSLFSNLKLYKFLKWWRAFAKRKTDATGKADVNIKDIGNSGDIIRKDMKDNENNNIEKAEHLIEFGEYEEAMELFSQEAEADPENVVAWEGLWICYGDNRRYNEAEEFFKKQLKMHPGNYTLRKILAECLSELGGYYDREKYKEAVIMYEELIEDNPGDGVLYFNLGNCYEGMGEVLKSKVLYEEALTKGIKAAGIYQALGYYYCREKNYEAAERLYLKAFELYPKDQVILGLLGSLYLGQGRHMEAQGLFNKASKQRGEDFNTVTWFNYLKLQNILKEKQIKLLCMQYPMRPLKELKKMFTDPEGIIFVDNEKIFKDALRSSRFEELFSDNIAGDFGHCTPKGNRLIAENLANIILDCLGIYNTT